MEMFDNQMQFRMPPDSDVAVLPPEAQERFKSVRAANDKLGDAIKHRERIEARIKENDAARVAMAEQMKSLRPVWTPTDEAKAWIRSQQEERARERGY